MAKIRAADNYLSFKIHANINIADVVVNAMKAREN
jgi:hypothetical protein